MFPATTGAWTSGMNPSPTRRVPPTLAPALTIKPIADDHIGALRAMDPTHRQDHVGVQEQGPALGRRLGDARQSRVHPVRPKATSRPLTPRPARNCGSSKPVRAWSVRRSPGSRTANNMSRSCPAGAAQCRCGAAKWPRHSRKSARVACSGCSSCRSNCKTRSAGPGGLALPFSSG